MVSKNQKKLIKGLAYKKYRKQHGLFVAEGKKVIQELLDAQLTLHSLFAVAEVSFVGMKNEIHEVSEAELAQLSFLTTPQSALAVFYIPIPKSIDTTGLIVALDSVRDPGNLGTIIRLCDWFGIAHLVCDTQTVDCYNPKVIQATMGSITRVQLHYVTLPTFIATACNGLPIFGTYMDGEVIYKQDLPDQGVLVMGNEANGISEAVGALITDRIAIPRFGAVQATESLNVATATAIVLSEFRRGS